MRSNALPSNGVSVWMPLIVTLCVLATACGTDGDRAEQASPLAVEVLDAEGASLGSVAFPVSCNEDASSHMRLGLALLHNMTYSEAAGAFQAASAADPDCALAYWGVAMTYVHPLWPDVPSGEDFERGWTLLQQARELGPRTPREEAYVSALEAYYRDGQSRDESVRLASYAAAWQQVSADYPDDPEAALFHSLSLRATAPGSDPTFKTEIAAAQIAERILEQIPDHPGAHHYIIHSYDVPSLAERALPVARSYGRVAPDNSHALHMTSHIFTRLGLWEESIEFNARAAAAALRHPINGATSPHYLHAMDYLAYAHLQRTEDGEAQRVFDQLKALTGPVVGHAASAYAFAAVPARIALEQQRWSEAAKLSSRWPATISWDRFPHLEAIPEFARALGAAHTGDMETAKRSVARLGVLQSHAAAMPSAYDWGIQVEIQEIAARAWIAYAEGRTDEGLTLMRKAADLESTTQKNPVTPGEVLPAGELLGDMLLDQRRYDEARAAYDTALERSPNRFNSLYGAGRAAELGGNADAAGDYFRQLVALTPESGGKRPRTGHAVKFLGRS
jgi:tetratricopeptide (TPR) repeat protein